MKRLLFAFDLDGTLLDRNRTLTGRTLASLRRLSLAGHVLAVATARPPRMVQRLFEGTDLSLYQICYNGAVWRPPSGPLTTIALNNDLLRWAARQLGPGLRTGHLSVEAEDRWLSAEPLPPGDFFLGETPEVIPVHRFLGLSPTKILVTGCSDPAWFSASLGGRASVVVTDGGYLVQVMASGVGKETAVAAILGEVGLDFGRVVCFGDDHNDAGLFRVCGHPVAMANAVPELKALARATALSNAEEGVAAYLEAGEAAGLW